jgi:adenosine kinase
MTQLSPIIISGSIAMDRIMNFGGSYSDLIRPDNLSSLSVSVLLDNLVLSQGGVGANIAYSLALLGQSCVLLGSVGKDGRMYIDQLAKMGVDVSHVHESKLATASFNVITDAQQHQVGGFFPGAMSDSATLSFEPWKDLDPICVVSPHDPAGMRRQVQECTALNLRLCYDVGQQVSNLGREDLRAGVAAAMVLILNEYEMSTLADKTGMTAKEIKATVPVVVTSLGKDGSIVEGSSIETPLRASAVKPKQLADPTGAGDSYRAGFLYGWQRSWDWQTCAQLGAVCATYTIEQLGTQGHTFQMDEVSARYEENFNQALPQSGY